MTESPAELLERAADELAARAAATGDNVWGVGLSNPCFDIVDAVWNERGDLVAGPVAEADAHWISTMSPAVAAPLVAWLRGASICALVPEEHWGAMTVHAVAFAKQIVGEAS